MNEDNMFCKNCKYFLSYGNKNGECHFDAPFARKYKTADGLYKNIAYIKAWVQTSEEDWCGRFISKEKQNEKI